MRHIIVIAVLLYTASGVFGQDKGTKTGPVPQLTNETIAISDPITVTTDGMPEATVAVMPPQANAACKNGRLFFASAARIASIPLKQGTVLSPKITNVTSSLKSSADPTDPAITYDNHIVATKDGELIYILMGITWRDNVTHPDWWDQTKTNKFWSKNVSGGRGVIWVFRSTNCGDTWDQMPPIDAAKLTVGKEVGYCAWPRVHANEALADAGGWDGPYLYADRFKGNVYITAPCTSGKGEIGLVLMANKDLTEWKVVDQVKGAFFWRVPITTLSNGEVFIAYANSAMNKVFIGRAAAGGGSFDETEVGTLSSPSDLSTRAALKASVYAYTTLARFTMRSQSGSKEGYQLGSWFNSNGDLAYNIQRHKAAPNMNAATISGMKKGNSVLQGTFVETSGIDALGNDSPSIFYWLEQVGKAKFQVRFQPFIGGNAIAEPQTIATTFSPPSFTGDYLGGTSYRTSSGLWKFYLSWNRSGSLRFAEVTIRVPDRLPFQDITIKRVKPSLKIRTISGELQQKTSPVEVHKFQPALTKPSME